MSPAFPPNRFALWPALALLLAPLAAGAQPRAQDAAVLAGTCFNCHGPGGRATGAIPGLQGRPAAELRERLLAFRQEQVPDATVMPRLMKGYDDAQIEALAQWFAAQGGR